MKKGISFYFGYKVEPEERAKMLEDAGFECVMTIADPRFDNQNGTIEKQVELFKKYNLAHSSLHMKYRQIELPEFWKEGEIGDKMEQNLIDDVKVAKKFGFSCVVVHLFGEFNEIGLRRLDHVLEICKECNIPLAIENINDQKIFLQTMKHYKNNPLVKMCYDCGHHHLVDPEFDYISNFADKIICLHLHDNAGPQEVPNIDIDDNHTLNKYGTIDWSELAKRLAEIPNDVNLDYELIFNVKCPETAEEVVSIAIKQARELEEKIKFYKNQSK